MNYIGFAKDIHRLKKAKTSLVLGGYRHKCGYSIIAYSDGDIILHAIANAILGACGLKDIGYYFPDNVKTNKNIASTKILNYALKKIDNKNLKIQNIDLMIICDKIIINRIHSQIMKSLYKLLKTKNISLKATRFEQNKNLIEANAIVLLEKK